MVVGCVINDKANWRCTECGDVQQILQGGTPECTWSYDEDKTLEATMGFKTLHALCRVDNGQIEIPFENLKSAV